MSVKKPRPPGSR